MATAAQVVKTALQLILVQASEAALEPDEVASGIEYLNDMMTEWDGAGISLGFTIVTSLGDEVTVPAFANQAIKQGLAVRLGPQFGGVVSSLLDRNATASYRAMVNAAVVIEPSSFPSTLSVGSGNEGNNWGCGPTFYGSEEDDMLTEIGGSVLLENGDTP